MHGATVRIAKKRMYTINYDKRATGLSFITGSGNNIQYFKIMQKGLDGGRGSGIHYSLKN